MIHHRFRVILLCLPQLFIACARETALPFKAPPGSLKEEVIRLEADAESPPVINYNENTFTFRRSWLNHEGYLTYRFSGGFGETDAERSFFIRFSTSSEAYQEVATELENRFTAVHSVNDFARRRRLSPQQTDILHNFYENDAVFYDRKRDIYIILTSSLLSKETQVYFTKL